VPYLVLGAAAVIYLGLTGWSYYYLPAHGDVGGHWFQLILVKFRDRNFVLWFFYFFAGGMAGLGLHKWRGIIRKSASWNLPLWMIGLIWVCYELWAGAQAGTVNLNISTSLKPSMALYTFSSIILAYSLAWNWSRLKNGLAYLIKLFGEYSLGAYFVHNAPITAMIVSFGLCAAGALLFALGVSRIYGLRILTGDVGKRRLKYGRG
jgi:hypothetical protein